MQKIKYLWTSLFQHQQMVLEGTHLRLTWLQQQKKTISNKLAHPDLKIEFAQGASLDSEVLYKDFITLALTLLLIWPLLILPNY